ncbi:uncharacterized protein C8Q71DRAFT_139849 [Rhodofomes roseus]|uniref:Uncharacterized protein n=1 Tax=Rhodofomes roseus TaxID=34475 RepID=A0ABQ8KAB9_9APHY|nr:uncharacterized protein C8Q71DRAFT_139849 [Rhodofomes roseus]KAH9834410.1 hypothetical protein C8Q71DRAFT_139849 [Rhodofomes roseus]
MTTTCVTVSERLHSTIHHLPAAAAPVYPVGSHPLIRPRAPASNPISLPTAAPALSTCFAPATGSPPMGTLPTATLTRPLKRRRVKPLPARSPKPRMPLDALWCTGRKRRETATAIAASTFTSPKSGPFVPPESCEFAPNLPNLPTTESSTLKSALTKPLRGGPRFALRALLSSRRFSHTSNRRASYLKAEDDNDDDRENDEQPAQGRPPSSVSAEARTWVRVCLQWDVPRHVGTHENYAQGASEGSRGPRGCALRVGWLRL